jgi:hypothetical protein
MKKTNTKKFFWLSMFIAFVFLILVIFLYLTSKTEYTIFLISKYGFIASLISTFIVAARVGSEDWNKMVEEVNSALKNIPNFRHTNVSYFIGGFIAIDENSQQIAIKKNYSANPIAYKYSDILSCEIINDNESIYKKSTIRTIGGAIVGGILTGGAGAVVGGLSGQSKKEEKYKKIQLKLVVRNTSNPSVLITFFDIKELEESNGIDNYSTHYGKELKIAINKTNKWKDIIKIIIDKIDADSNSTPNEDIVTNTNSIADELLKLSKLKKEGILSDKEFNEQKKKLLKQ